MFPMVPSVVHQLIQSNKLQRTDLSSVLCFLCGAAHLPKRLGAKLLSIKDAPIITGYGLSEATVSVCMKPLPGVLGGLQPMPDSIGILMPGIEARIVREDGSHADFNEPGELWLRGGNVVLGYAGDVQSTKESFVNGWLRTGDRVKVDYDHTFYFVDRVKDTMKISGVQVSPTEIETVLRSHPQELISDVCVAGVSGGRFADEKVSRAWIVLSEAGRKLGPRHVMKELFTWSQQNLSRQKWLRGGIQVIAEIPKLATGKVLRRVLQDNYEESSTQARL